MLLLNFTLAPVTWMLMPSPFTWMRWIYMPSGSAGIGTVRSFS